MIESNSLIDSGWVSYARQTIADHESLYQFYIHTVSESIEIGGGPYGRQTISPLRVSPSDEEFLVASLTRLDSLIDLDFKRTWNPSEASTRYFLDSEIEVDGNPLGITTTNGDRNERWFEIILDGSRLVDQAYRRYASLHEYGHTLGLEHPFDDGDGDSSGGTNPWTSSIFPEDTVMAYRRPLSGSWPQWFSASDIRALVETWGLEDDQRGSYQVSRISTGQPLMIGDPATAQELIASGVVELEEFKACQREVFGSSADDELTGFAAALGSWTDEWFYGGAGSDLILGGGGRDQLLGGSGNDTLRGGHGQDVLEGGSGSDELYGGGGRNTLIPGAGQDFLYVLSDHVSHGEVAGRNHGGSLADILLGIERDDRITILGCNTEELTVIALEEGYGIQAQGVLEAIILDSDVSQTEIAAMLSGDATRWF